MTTKKRSDGHVHSARVKFRMPATGESDIGEVEAEPLDAMDRSPLGIYAKASGVTLTAFSRAIGVPYKTVQEWGSGKSLPSLPAAYEIERVTKGVVPMEAWLSLPSAKSTLAGWRADQPEAMRKNAGLVDAGGFAHPLKKVGVQNRKQIAWDEEDAAEAAANEQED